QIAEKIWAGEQPAWRLDAKKAAGLAGNLTWEDKVKGPQVCEPEILGDFIVVRKGIGASYHLSVVVDDAAQEIDLVVRGEDLFRVTHVHRLLQALLDLPTPVWHHHDLVLDSDGKRLAKRTKATTLKDLRHEGWTPEQVRRAVGFG
ncbi:MAG: glutamate--tRNA ligase family protein, partial [Alphaproteobacteria bacterium]